MARISKYTADSTVDKYDKLIGSDSSGGTKNYSLDAVAKFLSNTNAIGVNTNLPFKYMPDSLGDGCIGLTTYSLLSSAYPTGDSGVLRVSKFTNSSQKSSLPILNTFLNKEIIISQIQDPTVFAVYRVSSITQHGNTNFYDFALKHLNSNNNDDGYGFLKHVYYNITLYSGAQDKDYTLDFTTGMLVEDSGEYYLDVPHELGKFPSITVKISTGSIVEVPIKHINKNNSKIYFKGLNSGTVYAN